MGEIHLIVVCHLYYTAIKKETIAVKQDLRQRLFMEKNEMQTLYIIPFI